MVTVWTDAQIMDVLAQAYFASAKAGANMTEVTKALELIRSGLGASPHQPIPILEELSDRVGVSFGSPEQAAMTALRAAYIEALVASYSAAIREAYERDEDEGWELFVTAFAELAIAWRFDLARGLAEADLPHADKKDEECALLAKGARYAAEDRWYEAYAMFRLLATQLFLPEVQIARFFAAQALIELYFVFRSDSAQALIDIAARHARDDAVVITARGEHLLALERIEEARQQFRRAIETDPRHVTAHCRLGDCSLREKDFESAKAWYDHALKLRPGDTTVYSLYCRLFAEGPETADPIPELEQRLMVIDPTAVVSFDLEAASAYQTRRDLSLAREWYQRAIDRDPERVTGYAALGNFLLDHREFDEARSAFLKAVDVARHSLDGYWGMARLSEQLGQWAETESWSRRAIRRRSEWAGLLWTNIARARIHQGNLEGATAAAIEAVRVNSSDEEVLASIERVANDMREVHGIAAALQICAALRATLGDGYEARYHHLVGTIYSAADDSDAAMEAFEKALESDNSKPAYWIALAQELSNAGQWERIRALAASVPEPVQADPSFRSSMALLRNQEANAAFTAGDYGRAAALFEDAVRLSPADPVLFSNLAIAREADMSEGDIAKRTEGVQEALIEAVRLDPANSDYRKRLQAANRAARTLPLFADFSLERLPVTQVIGAEIADDLVQFAEAAPGVEGMNPQLQEALSGLRERLAARYGLLVPGIRVRDNPQLSPGAYRLLLQEVPRGSGSVDLDRRFCPDEPAAIAALNIPFEPAVLPDGVAGSWIARPQWDAAIAAGLELWSVIETPVRHLEALLEENLALVITLDWTYDRLQEIDADLLRAVESARGGVQALMLVLRAFVAERVSLRELKLIADQYLELNGCGLTETEIVEELRALPKVAAELPGKAAGTSFVELGPEIEREIEESIDRDGDQPLLVMTEDACAATLKKIRDRTAGVSEEERVAFVVESPAIRPFVRMFIAAAWPDLPVLSRRELVADVASTKEAASGATA